MNMTVHERFLKYVSYPTTSDENNESCPSTQGQMVLARELCNELLALGLDDARVDEHGYVYASIPASCEGMDSIGFVAHMDTASEASGENIKPKVIDYEGGDILLNAEQGIVLKASDYPFVATLAGQRLIVTDGTTLLGADDKAGIAEIMSAVEKIQASDIPHGKICIGFTPDEEIGRGVDFFDVKAFGADFAYTMDGGFEGELEYENFNAASAKIAIQGRNVHPGYAKNKMINAIEVACELNSMIPATQRPEYTEGYEGFYHCVGFNGTVEEASVSYIIRDHDFDKFEAKKVWMWDCVGMLNKKYGGALTLTIKDQYYNMRKQVEPHPQVIELAKEAMYEADVTPIVRPIRGGTDGARLSFMGLPCPNIFAGGMNFHGKFEYCSLNSMEKAVKVIINLCKLWAK